MKTDIEHVYKVLAIARSFALEIVSHFAFLTLKMSNIHATVHFLILPFLRIENFVLVVAYNKKTPVLIISRCSFLDGVKKCCMKLLLSVTAIPPRLLNLQ